MPLRYVCIDLETSDLLPRFGQIYEMAAILNDPTPDIPPFHAYVYPGTHLKVTPWSIKNLDWSKYRDKPVLDEFRSKYGAGIDRDEESGIFHVSKYGLHDAFRVWCLSNDLPVDLGVAGNGLVVAAGKNFAGFDQQFLITHDPRFCSQTGKLFSRRTLDPMMLYLTPDDALPPNLAECQRRAGIKPGKAHTAMDDAKAVLELLQAKGF